jgi:hypothetical protein
MYGFIWKKLPGSKLQKSIEAAVLIIAVIALLFLVVFPWVNQLITQTEPSTVTI